MMKLGSATFPAPQLMPYAALPLMTLPGPMTFANGEPTVCTPLWPFGTAMLPVTSVPIMLSVTNTPAMFSLNISMPFCVLPEITLPVISTGPSCALARMVVSCAAKLAMSAVETGCTGNEL